MMLLIRTTFVVSTSLVILGTLNVAAQNPSRSDPSSISDTVLMLLRIPEIRDEIGITETQSTSLKQLEMQFHADTPVATTGTTGVLSKEQRSISAANLRSEQDAKKTALKADLKSTLLEGQIQRLNQIAVQVRGIKALEDEDIQKELNLTTDQIARFDSIRESIRSSMNKTIQSALESGDRKELIDSIRNRPHEFQQRMLGVLTDAQRSKFTQMKGEPIASLQPKELPID